MYYYKITISIIYQIRKVLTYLTDTEKSKWQYYQNCYTEFSRVYPFLWC